MSQRKRTAALISSTCSPCTAAATQALSHSSSCTPTQLYRVSPDSPSTCQSCAAGTPRKSPCCTSVLWFTCRKCSSCNSRTLSRCLVTANNCLQKTIRMLWILAGLALWKLLSLSWKALRAWGLGLRVWGPWRRSWAWGLCSCWKGSVLPVACLRLTWTCSCFWARRRKMLSGHVSGKRTCGPLSCRQFFGWFTFL